MLGDVLLINDMHKSAASSIMKKVLADKQTKEGEDPDHKYVVAISGESGAGKSELSHSLALMLKGKGIRVKVLHTDNYYLVPPLLRKEWRMTNGLESVGINEYDWNLVNRNIRDFKENRETIMPCIDIIPDQIDRLITDFHKIHLLVIDGLYAINIKEADLRVFIELTYHETKISQLMRGKEPSDEYRMQVLEREHINVQSLKPMADLLVNRNYEVVEAGRETYIPLY
jgi:uridine kinase